MANRLSKINDRLHARSRAAELLEDILAIEMISAALTRPPVRPVPPTPVGRFTLSWEVQDGQPGDLVVFCRNKDALSHLAWYLNRYGRYVRASDRSPDEIRVGA